MNTSFIDKLRSRNSTFNAPEAAINSANSLNSLSRDIYTDSTRFIYELLQNADDASCKSGSLAFQIDFIEDYLVVSHQGKPFDQDDVEAICSIGDGCKASDSEQTGFKGIGFKSVFAYSDCVIVKSGDFCFKFDKEAATDVWAPEWGNQLEWQQIRKSKNKSAKVNLPWQIIPINTIAPNCIPSRILASSTVITIIKSKKINELKYSIKELFSSAQLILFLRSKNVSITINFDEPLHIEKRTDGESTTISRGGMVISEWLMHTTTSFIVPQYVKDQMEEDKEHYPEKLREATKASLSFAISIKDGKLEKLENETKNIYAFLPTEVSQYDFPFIVNSNFITDAGRQNLHQDYIWNQWLFEEMPTHYLAWIAQIAEEGKYGLDFLKLISKKSGVYDKLGDCYNQSMANTLALIPILPNNGRLLKVAEAILDKTAISSYINSKYVIEYLGKNHKSYSVDGLLHKDYMLYRSQLAALGVTIFDEDKLKELISSEQFINEQDATENAKLINYLSSVYDLQEHKEETLMWLQSTPFVLTESGKMLHPLQVCFPNINNGDSKDIETICNSVYQSLSESDLRWLREVGVSDMSDTSIIDTGKLFEDGYITENNAIEIGRDIFKLHKKAKLNDHHYDLLHYNMPVISQKGSLKKSCDMYLSDKYKPELPMEKYVDIDMFLSEKYICDTDSISEWKAFLEKIGLSQSLSMKRMVISRFISENDNIVFNDFIDSICNIANTFKWEAYVGWAETGYHFYSERIVFSGVPFLNYAINYAFSKILWSNILSNGGYEQFITDDNLYVIGSTGMIQRTITSSQLKTKGAELNYLSWVLANKAIIPCTDGSCYLAKDVYSNAIPKIKEVAGECLPIIDLGNLIEPEWANVLGLKQNLGIGDLLQLLTKIQTDNWKRSLAQINTIYDAITNILTSLTINQKLSIKKWAEINMVMAVDGNFYRPSELNYITIDGFSSKYQIYTGNLDNKESLIELLRLFGVRIITEDNISAEFEESDEDDRIRDRLISIAPMLALLDSSNKDKEYYESKLVKVRQCIEDTVFLSCRKIYLTIKDSDAKLEKQTYAEKGKFYFVGTIKPATIEPLLTPLCSYLGLKHKERELFVLLIEQDYSSIIEFLKEKEYPIEWLPLDSTSIVKTTTAVVGGRIGGDIEKERQRADSEEAKTLVLAHLASKGFDVEHANKTYSVIPGVKKDNIDYPLVVKSCKSFEHRININPDEWRALFKPNSMLWIHAGGGIVLPIKAHELFTYQDKLTLSFDTVNLLMDERVNKIMDVMRYFNNVHLNLATLNPDQHRGESLDDYLFNETNEANNDLSVSPID